MTGRHSVPVFAAPRYQRGYGVGSFLKTLARTAAPFVRQAGKSILSKGLETALNVGQDLLSGSSLKSSLSDRGKQAAQDLLIDAVDTSTSRKRKRKPVLNQQPKRRKTTRKVVKKKHKKTRDIFS